MKKQLEDRTNILKAELEENKRATDEAIENQDQEKLNKLFKEYDKIFNNLLMAQQEQVLSKNKKELEDMEKAKIFKGIKVRLWNGAIKNVPYTSMEAYEKFTEDTYQHELVNKENELYLCGILNLENNLDGLHRFREGLLKEKGYNTLLNKEEIEKELEKGYIVAIKGLGEIDNIQDIK